MRDALTENEPPVAVVVVLTAAKSVALTCVLSWKPARAVEEPPPPAGVAQVPSPRQKVVEEAEVPDPRLVTGRLPVTPVVSGRPVALVKVAEVGVPRIGVTRVGEVA